MAEVQPKRLGQFEIRGELGRGGMAVVFKGYQPSLDREVAIKTLPVDMTQNREMVSRFKREIGAMVALNHTNIVQIIDSGEEQGLYYYAMEFVDGPALKELMQDEGLTVDRAFDVALQICDGLAYAHKKGIVHRDIKPANILWETSTGLAKIADFGIARLVNKDTEMITLTATSVGMGTMNYMAPEQKTNAAQVDHRADIYSVGVVLYEMFTGGKLPLGRFKLPSELTPGLPRELDDVIARCLEADPADRWDSLMEVRQGLEVARERALAQGEGGQLLKSVRDAAEKTLTAVAGQGNGPVLAGVCLFLFLFLGAAGAGGYYLLVVRGKGQGQVASNDGQQGHDGEGTTGSPTESPDSSPQASQSPAASPKASPSARPSPSAQPSPSPSAQPSPSEQPSPSPSAKPSTSAQPSPSPSAKPSPSPRPSPSPVASPQPSAVVLGRDDQELLARVEGTLAEIADLERRWGQLPSVRSKGGLDQLAPAADKLKASGDPVLARQLRDRIIRLRNEAQGDLWSMIKEQRKSAGELLGMSKDVLDQVSEKIERFGGAPEDELLSRHSLVLEELVQAQIEVYRAQGKAAFALALQRGSPAELEEPRKLLEQVEKSNPGLLEREDLLARAVDLVQRVGVPGSIHGLELVDQHRFTLNGDDLEGVTSVCPADGGGVACVGRNASKQPYLVLLDLQGGKIRRSARVSLPEKSQWVASAGRTGQVNSYWVGDFTLGPQSLHRYGFDQDDKPLPKALEQVVLDLAPKEFVLDLASGVDGALYVLTDQRLLVLFGPEGQRTTVGQVDMSHDWPLIPVPRKVAPLLGGRAVVSGDPHLDLMQRSGSLPLWSPQYQAAWGYVLKRYDARLGRSLPPLRVPDPGPCAVIGLGDQLLGVGYTTDGGGLLQVAQVDGGRTQLVNAPDKSNYLATDAAYTRGLLWVIDLPNGPKPHVRQRLAVYRTK